MWKFESIKTYRKEAILLHSDCFAFHGDLSLDDRSEFVEHLFEEFSIEDKIYIKYKEENFGFVINCAGTQKIIQRHDLESIIREKFNSKCIIIDATTLSFAEILYLLSDLNKIENISNVQILYVEPSEYKLQNSSITTYDEFSLSDKLNQLPPLPGFTINAELEKIDLIAFLGFEKQRLGQIFSPEDIVYENFTPIVPLPGFLPGWENRTINNHLKFFDPRYRLKKIKYVSANNPYQTLKLLEEVAKTGKSFRVAPIGTKPNAIGCAVFLVNNENKSDANNYGALFDFPVKSKKRSKGIGKIYVYNLVKEVT